MKTTRIFAAALALLSVLSCQKEEQQTIGNSENEGGAIITCTFASNDAATKTTTTDGKTPLWAAGDEIMLYDGSSQTQKLTLAASGTASSTEGIIDGADATKFTFVKPSGWENVYAIYPYSACVTSFSASDPKLNFAGQDGTFAKANICAAAEISGTMSFKNVGAILKFPSKPAPVTDILIPMAGLAKDYTVSFSGAAPSLTPVDETNSISYNIGGGKGAIYIGVPAGNLAAGMNFIYQDSNKDILGSYTTGNANNIDANKVYTLSAIAANGTIPTGMLSKAFSVSATEKVYFSNGNLYCKRSSSSSDDWTWGFYANQYQYNSSNVGTDGKRPVAETDTEIDIFCWGYDATGSVNPVEKATHPSFTDWGQSISTLPGNSESTKIWKTLSKDECKYLLNTTGAASGARTDANRFAKAMVNDVKGLIIFPDGYATVPSDAGIAAVNTSNAAFPTSSIADATWSAMESAGCVFLPAAGDRTNTTTAIDVGLYGYYWYSTPDGTDKACCLHFSNNDVSKAKTFQRKHCCSVRLVSAAQ